MRKLILSAFILVTFATTTFADKGDQQTIATAKAALVQNCSDVGGNLKASVTNVSSCLVDGFVKRVVFYKTPNCPPNTYCIQSIIPVGYVLLDCENNVLEVSCGAVVQ